MTEATAPKRLSKVAKEFNLSTSTIVDYLKTQKIEIEDNPNCKITDDVYEVILKKYLPDKVEQEKTLPKKEEVKVEKKVQAQQEPEQESGSEIFIKSNLASKPQKATVVQDIAPVEKVVVKEIEKKVVTEPIPEQKETAEKPILPEAEKAIEKPVIKESEKEVEKPIVVEEVRVTEKPLVIEEEKVTEKPTVKEEEPVIEKTVTETQPVEEKPEQIKPSEPIQEIIPEVEEKETTGLKVVGKIDLDQPIVTQPIKEIIPEPVIESVETEEIPEAKSEIIEEPVIVHKESVIEEEKPIIEEVIEPVSTRREEDTLPGLTILGKIDVESLEPEKYKKKLVVSTADPNSMVGKNRKRFIKKKGKEKTPAEKEAENKLQQDKKGKFAKKDDKKERYEKKQPEKKVVEVDEKAIKEQIAATLSKLTSKQQTTGLIRAKIKKKQKRELREKEQMAYEASQGKGIEVIEFITANDLANVMGVNVAEVITACLNLGLMVSINQRLDAETITIVADEFGFEVKFKEESLDEPSLEEQDDEERMVERAPVVTIMGHVDHGKTSLLDHIRSTRVTEGEAGGITQHIGAYSVVLPNHNNKRITFLDTPGHEAFTSMRARGAKITDLVIIVIAADDSVMPQTREAISHAQAAGVPIVFAINKIDKPGANPEKIREQLAEMNLLVEEWGGKFQCQEISAKKGLNINELLEKVMLEAEMLELKADSKKRAIGTVIEASLDKGKGIIASVLVQKGTLKVGDSVLAGAFYAKVKALFDERGKKIMMAGPSVPVEILGFDGSPTAGDKFYVTETEQQAKEMANARKRLIREQNMHATKHLSLEEIGRRIALGNFKELNIIIKGDVDGSVEALSDSLQKLSNEEVQVNVIHKGVGQISESDVLLASASDAIIIGFQVRPSLNARKLAESEQIEIRTYSVIYSAIEELKLAIEGLLAPEEEEKILCNIEVRDVFRITKVGTVAGCMVLDGKVNRNTRVRLIREGVIAYTGEIESLKRFKEDVREVSAGYECGISITNFNDIKEGDIIEGFVIEQVKRKL